MLAIYLLRELYSEKEDEWTLIAKKAREYLESVGLEKP